MQSILKHLKSMEAKMHALLAEMQELKYDIRQMEQENDRLRQELAACYSKIAIDAPDAGTAGKKGVAFSNLLELYDQDFHICNLYFGHRREGECLFCMAFLRRETDASGPEAKSADLE